MAMAADDIARMIKDRFPDAEIRIEDLAGDGDHYAAVSYTHLTLPTILLV